MAHRGIDATCRSKAILRLLFGVRVPHSHVPTASFDVTTYVLSRYLRHRLSVSSDVVDMGTGPTATLGLFLWKQTGCSVTCVDVDAGFVASARAVIAHNDAPIDVVRSHLLDDVSARVDTVVFNPPYVSTETGQERGLPPESRSQWDGGADGTDVIQMFLGALAGSTGTLVAYMGVNRRHVVPERVTQLIESHPSLRLEGVAHGRLLPVCVFTLCNRVATATP